VYPPEVSIVPERKWPVFFISRTKNTPQDMFLRGVNKLHEYLCSSYAGIIQIRLRVKDALVLISAGCCQHPLHIMFTNISVLLFYYFVNSNLKLSIHRYPHGNKTRKTAYCIGNRLCHKDSIYSKSKSWKK